MLRQVGIDFSPPADGSKRQGFTQGCMGRGTSGTEKSILSFARLARLAGEAGREAGN